MTQVEKEQTRSAYREGIFVRALGRSLDSNPYPSKSEDGLLWEEGWRVIDGRRPNAKRFGEEPILALRPEASKDAIEDSGRQPKSAPLQSFFPPVFRIFHRNGRISAFYADGDGAVGSLNSKVAAGKSAVRPGRVASKVEWICLFGALLG
jgi:hypothetical protein